MKNDGGRPRKISVEELKQIVDHYYIAAAGEDPTVMSQHGIFARLADYAKSKGISAEGRDFSRSSIIREYIFSLSMSPDALPTYTGMLPFDAIDIDTLTLLSRTELEKLIIKREDYAKNLYRMAGEHAKNAESIQCSLSALRKQMDTTTTQLEHCRKENDTLKGAQKDMDRLIKLLKETAPDRAEEFAAQADKEYEAVASASVFAIIGQDADLKAPPMGEKLALALEELKQK